MRTEKIEAFDLDEDVMLLKPEVDPISITRKYTRELEVESVPTIYINGVKVIDPFDVEQIIELVNQTA